MKKNILILFCFFIHQMLFANGDSTFIKVHFLYGSKPKKEFRKTEKKWFGGKLGGHAGIECGDNGKILHFIFQNKAHVVAKKKQQAKYVYNSYEDFYSILGGKMQDNKRAIVSIPCSAEQKRIFDSLVIAYTTNCPYDYGFIGMRCGSATYDGLAQLGIFKQFGLGKTKMLIFYPRKTRKRVLKLAKKNGWNIEWQEGNERRSWEKDV